MKRILFIDRDGTIIQEPPDEQIDSLEKLMFVPGAISNLRKIREQSDYLFVMVSNQDGLGTDSFPDDTFWPAHNKMLEILENEQVIFDNILIDRSFPHENLPTRKPGTAMMTPYMNSSEIDMANSYVLGDRMSDVQLAGNLGCQAIYISDEDCPDAALATTDWDQIYRFLCLPPRTAKVERKTNETDILVEVNLDGNGKSDLNSGIGFLDHMLDQLARHSGMDLIVKCNGDLDIDEHHSAEDIALALGQALKIALGNKKGISRFGFMAPMDECLAQVALDFSGRPELVWKVEFKREYIGKMPTELFRHIFKSLSDTSAMTLNIQAEGENEHHKIEAVFKAFGRALKMAVSRDGSNSVPSTKGIL